MESIGERLKLEREAKNLTLDDVQKATKIRKQYLAAIEAGRFDEIPGEVYVKGFIRNYADFIGLDGSKLVEEYSLSKREDGTERPPGFLSRDVSERGLTFQDRGAGERKGRGDFRRKAKREWVFVALLSILALGAAGFWLWGKDRPASSTTVEPSMAPPPEEVPGVPPAGTPGVLPAEPSVAPSPATQGAAPAPQAESQGTESMTPGPAGPGGPAGPESPAGLEANRAVVVRVKVLQRCWVRVTADGKVIAEGALLAGQQAEWTADKEIMVRFGNAGGVEVEFNGKNMGRPGGPGEVIDLKFPPPQARPSQASQASPPQAFLP